MPSEVPRTIPEALGQAASRFQDVVAYVEGSRGGGKGVTWHQLYNLVRETAAGLVALGLRRGDRLAICAENSIDWLVTCHAALLAGAVPVLVYYDLKAGEIESQVERPASRFLAASAPVLAKLGRTPAMVDRVLALGDTAIESALTLAAVRAAATDEARDLLDGRAPQPNDIAAIIYTSGTTGGAKGVMLTHRNFITNARDVVQVFSFSERDSVVLVLPLHHAMPFMATVVLPPFVGAKFVIENDLARIRDRLVEHKPTIFFGVPALYELMYRNVMSRAESEGRLQALKAWQARARRVKRLTGVNIGPLIFRPLHRALGGKLRFMVSGGAALSPQTALDFYSLGLPLLQGWGMTEAAPAIAVQRFSRRRFLTTRFYERHAGSVGRALPSVEVRLIDVPEKDIRVDVAGEGEVIVRGDNVFPGYWQAEEATQEAKLDGWLRTGDLARIERDGEIFLTGRSKYIIVLESGEKVHPDELEETFRRSDVLQDICIVGRKLRDRTQVTAVVYPDIEAVKARGGVDGPQALEGLVASEVERLGRSLAAYKRVSRIELSDTPLPKTPLRKVARGQLQEAFSFDFDRWLASSDSP